jgi:hypothetical protein
MKLILGPWEGFFKETLIKASKLRIMSPSFSMVTIQILQERGIIENTRLITRYSLYDFFVKLSDLAALKLALHCKMKVVGLRNIHAKFYLFDDDRAIITSANFTYGGLSRNHECGMFIDDRTIVTQLSDHFDHLWQACEPILKLETCLEWETRLNDVVADILTPNMLPDYGMEYAGSSFPGTANVQKIGDFG